MTFNLGNEARIFVMAVNYYRGQFPDDDPYIVDQNGNFWSNDIGYLRNYGDIHEKNGVRSIMWAADEIYVSREGYEFENLTKRGSLCDNYRLLDRDGNELHSNLVTFDELMEMLSE